MFSISGLLLQARKTVVGVSVSDERTLKGG